MKVKDPKTIALQFNDCINTRNIEGLGNLMSDNHQFIDTLNNVVKGKQACLKSWSGFFKMFPDYKNIFKTITAKNNFVTMTGHSVCSDKRLDGPALWSAKIEQGKVAEWHVYEYTSQNMQLLDVRRAKKNK